MEDRFDRLEQMIGGLGTHIDGVEQRLGTHIDGVEQTLGARIYAISSRIDGLDSRVDGVEGRLGAQIDGVQQTLGAQIAGVDQRLSGQLHDLSNRVSVLHEDVKSDFRFSLEALQGVQEQIDRRFQEQDVSFKETLAPLLAAVRDVRPA